MALSVLFVLLLGACVGSFLNVVVWRLPRGESLLWPPSHCPHCDHRLAPRDNIPVLGWLLLRGRCRYCRGPVAVRYPLVEAATAVWFLLCFLQTGPTPLTLGAWILGSWLLALSLIDLDTMTLPNALTASGAILGLVWALLPTGGPGIFPAVLGLAIGLWSLDLLGFFGSLALGQPAMGGGDSKLAGLLGAWLGPVPLVVALFLACLSGSIYGLGGRWTGRLKRRQAFPFGPFLALGGAIAWFHGQALADTYWQLLTVR